MYKTPQVYVFASEMTNIVLDGVLNSAHSALL